MLENKHRASVIGSQKAPYLNALAARGANMTHSVRGDPPEPAQLLALFSGSTQGVDEQRLPADSRAGPTTSAPSWSPRAAASPVTPSPCPTRATPAARAATYQRKHNPWVNFATVPSAANQPFSAFPTDFTRLPTVSFVSPNMCHDMHDCSVATGDAWLKANLDAYAVWAMTHNSLLVVTFDENAGGTVNQIPTLMVGQASARAAIAEPMNHYTLSAPSRTPTGSRRSATRRGRPPCSHLDHLARRRAGVTGVVNGGVRARARGLGRVRHHHHGQERPARRLSGRAGRIGQGDEG